MFLTIDWTRGWGVCPHPFTRCTEGSRREPWLIASWWTGVSCSHCALATRSREDARGNEFRISKSYFNTWLVGAPAGVSGCSVGALSTTKLSKIDMKSEHPLHTSPAAHDERGEAGSWAVGYKIEDDGDNNIQPLSSVTSTH